MEWSKLYLKGDQPELAEIEKYIDNVMWKSLCDFIETTYLTVPSIEHSSCGMSPGWNVKYKKSGKSMCTLYPHKGFFTCLVVIGNNEEMEAELMINSCDPYIQTLYQSVKPFNGGRWLMIDVTSTQILEDVKKLITLRAKTSKKAIKFIR